MHPRYSKCSQPRRAPLNGIVDVQELSGVGEERVLQRGLVPQNHCCEPSSLSALLHMLTRLQDFMIQGGDPTGTGRGGTSIYGQKLYVDLTL